MASFGRTKIVVDAERVDETNVLEILAKARPIHQQNRIECQHLYDVYRGKQAVLNRTKAVREEINNKLLINHANEIVSFKVSYLLSEPIAYIARGANASSEKIARLNEMMYLNNKAARDKEIADDFMICGHAYRIGLPNKRFKNSDNAMDEAPFVVHTLDPRDTFIVYSSAMGEPPICGVKCATQTGVDGQAYESDVYGIYTPERYIEIRNGKIVKNEPHMLGMIPIIEYVNNNARLGAFEVVETLLDAMNILASNRVDATEQAVQALTVFYNCDISTEGFAELKRKGALKIKSVEGMESKVEMLVSDFNQTDQQVLMDALYDEVLRITGMPSQSNGNTSDSSNNGATIVRNGWFNAEARAKDTEDLWRESEGEFLKLVLRICRGMTDLDIRYPEIALKFTRRNYEDLQVRTQALTTMLGSQMIAPRLAFAHCGLFVDPEEAYTESMKWYEEQLCRQAEMVKKSNAQASDEPATQNETEASDA